MAATAVVAAVGLGSVLLAPSALRSETSSLEILPGQPTPGAHMTVTYHATPRFAGEERLVLRARFRRPGDPQYSDAISQVRAAVLTREGAATFTGTFQLPRDVVWGVLAVEDEAGRVLDIRGSGGWELLTYEHGRPSFEALLQQAYDAMGWNRELALRSITRATELYPQRVEGWNARGFFEDLTLGSSAFDSLKALHLPKLHAFDAALQEVPVDPATGEDMYFYASMWGDTAVADRWRDRLLRTAPNSPEALQLRAAQIVVDSAAAPDRALEELEALWAEADGPAVALARMAFRFARELGDATAMSRWATRRVALVPSSRLAMARWMVDVPVFRDTVLEWLDREETAVRTPDDSRRELFRTSSLQRLQVERTMREILGLRGRVLLAAGDVASASALLDSATASGWDLTLFEDLANARLSAGDVRGGIEMLARLAADPAYTGSDAPARAERLAAPTVWTREVAGARERMVEETLKEAQPHTIDADIDVADVDGTRHRLGDMVGGRTTVVAFFWAGCRACTDEFRRLQDLEGRSEPPHILLVSSGTIPPDYPAWLAAQGITLPIVTDPNGELAIALNQWGEPEYFVLDRDGTAQFSYTTLDDIPRQVLALERLARPIT